MIKNIDDVVKVLELNKIEYWRVLLKDADNSLVFESDDAGFASNVKRFREVMELCTGSRFYIKGSEKKGINRGNFYEEFRNLTDTPTLNGAGNSPVVQGLSPDEVERHVAQAITGLKAEMRMEQLEKENEELRKEVISINTPLNRVITKVEPYIGSILNTFIQKLVPSAPAIQLAGIELQPDEQTDEQTDEKSTTVNTEQLTPEHTRLMLALEKWHQADPEFVNLIETIANMVHIKDPRYAMAKTMLN